MRYDVVRSVEDTSVHVLFRAGAFDDLPTRIRHMGPWQGLSGGEMRRLKLHYRLQIAEQGFAVLYQPLATFSSTNAPQ
jgi:CHASE1-domain containing sensor protein